MLAFKLNGLSVSGSDVVVFEKTLGGIAGVRLMVENVGDQALTDATLEILDGPSGIAVDVAPSGLAVLDDGDEMQVRIPGPVERLRMTATCAAGTELDVSVITPIAE